MLYIIYSYYMSMVIYVMRIDSLDVTLFICIITICILRCVFG